MLDFHQPAVFMFSSDDFLEDVFQVLALDPPLLARFLAVPGATAPPVRLELPKPVPGFGSWQRRGQARRRERERINTCVPPGRPPPLAGQGPLKLFQPAHEAYALLAASLVTQQPGLPDRRVDRRDDESVRWVIRRLFAPACPPDAPVERWHEHAWIRRGAAWFWLAVPSGAEARALDGEEHLPMFPLAFDDDDGRRRQFWAGLIPTPKREEYLEGHRLDGPEAVPVPPDSAAKWFIARCVYERPACAPLVDDVVSDRSLIFELAARADAPQRHVPAAVLAGESPA